MDSNRSSIYVRSHVGRDLLQNAALFRHERQAIWEYVANGLQYVDLGTSPEVHVRIDVKANRVTIKDNGRGMNWEGLQNFFIMHGENIDRKEGKPGRGMFGTGKCAAFGIGHTLRITSTQGKKRSRVELRRSDIEAMESGVPIPVRVIDQERPTSEPNGTIVEIEDIHRTKIDRHSVVRFIENHIARWPDAKVVVDNHLCEYDEPATSEEHRIRAEEEPFRSALGEVVLILKVAKAPLERDQNGVGVFSSGVWHETTLAGCEGKEMAQYIFGEIDVPALAQDASAVPPFDLSRSMHLNPENNLVQTILAFVGFHIDRLRRRLVEDERKRRASEEAKRLEKEAQEISRILNDDFQAFRRQLAQLTASVSGGEDFQKNFIGTDGKDTVLIPGENIPADPLDLVGLPLTGTREGQDGTEAPEQHNVLEPSTSDNPSERADEKLGRITSRARGGFRVEFRDMGESESRAKYERDERTIYVNLGHPQLSMAVGLAGTEAVAFKRLAYEIAFAEYAIALAYEMSEQGHFIEHYEPIFEIRKTLDRITRSAAHLYVDQ